MTYVHCRYLKTRFHDLYDATSNRTSRVSTERVVSGPGIYNIYSFLVTKYVVPHVHCPMLPSHRTCPTNKQLGSFSRRAQQFQLTCAACGGIADASTALLNRFPDFVDAELHDEIEAAGDQRAGVIAKNSLHGKRNSLCKVGTTSCLSHCGSMSYLPQALV